jgi:hypothetical protein
MFCTSASLTGIAVSAVVSCSATDDVRVRLSVLSIAVRVVMSSMSDKSSSTARLTRLRSSVWM